MAPEEDYRPSDPVMEGRWLRALETAGIHVVRARLVQSPGGSTASISVGTEQNITKVTSSGGFATKKRESNKSKRAGIAGYCAGPSWRRLRRALPHGRSSKISLTLSDGPTDS